MAKKTGFKPDQHIDLTDERQIANLLSAMIARENGSNPYPADYIARAVHSAMPSTVSAPAGAGPANAGLADQVGRAVATALQNNPSTAHVTVLAPPGYKVETRAAAGSAPRVVNSMPTGTTP